MYNAHFGFSECPFSITPNSRFYFRTQSCDAILRVVKHGIESRKGVIVVTGEPGTGKTLLIKSLERDLSRAVKTVVIQNPRTDFDRMLEVILDRLELRDIGDRTVRFDRLTARLIEQRSQGVIVCLLVDEAQDLDTTTLDDLRLLANLEVDGDALLPILLVGQPELNVKLDHPSAARMKQRVALTRNTHPLIRMEIEPYIQWRLKVAGRENSLFAAEAIDAIADYSGGTPRIINSICDNSLIRAYTAKQRVISPAVVDQVARDLRIAAPFSFHRRLSRSRLVAQSSQAAGAADLAKYAGAESMAAATGVETLQPGTAQPQDLRSTISTRHGAEAIHMNGKATTTPDVSSALKAAAHGRGVHADRAVPHNLVSVRRPWYTVATVISLPLLCVSILSSSTIPNIFSAASSTKPAPAFNASPYRSLHRDAADSVEFTGTLVALSNPVPLPAQRIAPPHPHEGGKIDGQNTLKSANGKRTRAVKVSQTPSSDDGDPGHAEAARFPLRNASRSADAGKTLKVVATSLLRKKPSAGAEIVSSLEPGSRVAVLSKSGDFYHVRSLDEKTIRGYVHREDAFFEHRK
jgi:general secretion pathway protein A